MKRLLIIPLLALLWLVMPVKTAEAAEDGFALKVVGGCSGPCAEPYMAPKFSFEVLAGKWPEKGTKIHCVAHHSLVMECDGGLQLKITVITFRY